MNAPGPLTALPTLLRGDARALPLPDECVDLVVTSPPYFGLRDYGHDTQLGAEATPTEFIAALIECTREMARVLKPSGSIFVNLGDKYAGPHNPQNNLGGGNVHWSAEKARKLATGYRHRNYFVPKKSLLLLPERYRIAAVDDLGLIARAVIIWSKRSGLPDNAADRAPRRHEDWVHLAKSQSYHYEAAERPSSSVWEISSQPLRVPAELGVDHFAPFPMEWPRKLILGWSPTNGVVLDPFSGTGTTALVATMLGRTGIGVDLSADYQRLAQWRCSDPKERARAAGLDPDAVARVERVPAGQQDLFTSLSNPEEAA